MKYKNCEIWFDRDDCSTCLSSRWMIRTEPRACVVIYLDGTRTIEEVKRYIDGFKRKEVERCVDRLGGGE